MTTIDPEPRAAVWFLPLPEPIGIPQGFTLLFRYDEAHPPRVADGAQTGVSCAQMLTRATGPLDVAVRLWHVPAFSADEQALNMQAAQHVRDAVLAGRKTATEVELSDVPGHRRDQPSRLVTVAEVAALLPGDESGGDGDDQVEIDDLSHPLLRCIDCVKHVVRAYRLATQSKVADLSYMRLPKFIPTAHGPLRGRDAWRDGVTELGHTNLPYTAPQTMEAPALGRWAANIGLLSAGDPQALFAERILLAQRLLTVDGTPGGTLLLCAIATEAALDALLGMILWEENGGAPGDDGPAEAAAAVFSKDLRPRLRSEYSPRLGGSWDFSRPGPLAEWQARVAGVRNRVVHRGYEPRQAEADDAIEASQALYTHLADLLARRAKTYRRTAGMFVGEEGLRSRNAWQSVRAFYADQALTEGPWRENYATWRAKVDSLVERRARS